MTRIRAKTFEQWLKANLTKGDLTALAEHGAQNGFPGLTYYSDTCALYDKFSEEIWALAIEEAEQAGNRNVFEMIAQFGGANDVGNETQMKNLLVWYAAEHYARKLTGEEEPC